MKSITKSLCDRPAEFVLLPPIGAPIPDAFEAVETSDRLHAELLSSAQRFRGGIYLQDGAIRPQQLTSDGRHELPVDEESWHILTLDHEGRICACLRVHQQTGGRDFYRLPVSQSALTHCPDWGGKLRQAVESEIAGAHEARLHFGDVGGWAIAPERRRTLEPLRTILAGYSLMQHLGGVAGVVTATCKHGSAQILRRLGLHPLQAGGETIPVYYDPHYNSEMEVLSFDSRRPNPRYKAWIAELRSVLSRTPVVRAERRYRPVSVPPKVVFNPWNQVFYPRHVRPLIG